MMSAISILSGDVAHLFAGLSAVAATEGSMSAPGQLPAPSSAAALLAEKVFLGASLGSVIWLSVAFAAVVVAAIGLTRTRAGRTGQAGVAPADTADNVILHDFSVADAAPAR